VILLPYVAGSSGGVSGGLLYLGMVGGLVLAAVVKSGLRLAWRRATAKGKRPGVHRAGC
jgi:hypothetical protein